MSNERRVIALPLTRALLWALAGLTAAGLFALVSCSSSNPVDGSDDAETFHLQLAVSDSSGNPVQGLAVGLWSTTAIVSRPAVRSGTGTVTHEDAGATRPFASDCDVPFALRARGARQFMLYPNPLLTSVMQPTMRLWFSIGSSCQVRVSVSFVDGAPISVLVDEVLEPGSHIVGFDWTSVDRAGGTHVIVFDFEAEDPNTHETIQRDTLLGVVQEAPSWERCLVGQTSAGGLYETSERGLFPSLYDLPPILGRCSEGTPMWWFCVSDTLVIILADTTVVPVITQEFRGILEDGPNEFELSWSPGEQGFFTRRVEGQLADTLSQASN